MVNLEIKNSLSETLNIGSICYGNISLKNPREFAGYIKQELIMIAENHIKELPDGFNFSRRLYKSFSIDPTKHRPSSEALWRRLKNKGEFPQVSPVVDLTNLLSVKFMVPYGLYNMDKIKNAVEISLGSPNDSYEGIRKEVINLRGKVVLKDDLGAFGNPSSDSLRTSIDSDTKNIWQVVFFLKDDPSKAKVVNETTGYFKRFFSMATVDWSII